MVYSDGSLLAWARLALGLGGGIHGRWSRAWPASRSGASKRLRGVADSVSRLRRSGRTLAGGVAEGPCCVANSRWRPHTVGTPFFCLLWRGLC